MKTFTIGKAIIEAKVERSLQLLESISERYDVRLELQRARKEAMTLLRARTVSQLRSTEAHVALEYWRTFKAILPESLDFRGRLNETTHQFDASDAFNATLNFGYAILESECRKSVNATGLEAAIGFVHPPADYQIKEGLVFDLMEPFRWLIDLTTLQAFESRLLDIEDFFFTGDDYSYRFEPEAKRRFVEAIRKRFNSGVEYKSRHLRWDSVIQQKTLELAGFLTGKSRTLDFVEPAPRLDGANEREIRTKILALTSFQAKQLGIGKSSLHYLRNRARDCKPLKIQDRTLLRLESEAVA
jgi:CRISPR-associated protein Cas1